MKYDKEEFNEFYETSDLGVMSVLNLHGIKPIDFKTEGTKKIGVYENTQELETLVNNYLMGELMVDASAFNNSIKETKYIIFNVA